MQLNYTFCLKIQLSSRIIVCKLKTVVHFNGFKLHIFNDINIDVKYLHINMISSETIICNYKFKVVAGIIIAAGIKSLTFNLIDFSWHLLKLI